LALLSNELVKLAASVRDTANTLVVLLFMFM